MIAAIQTSSTTIQEVNMVFVTPKPRTGKSNTCSGATTITSDGPLKKTKPTTMMTITPRATSQPRI